MHNILKSVATLNASYCESVLINKPALYYLPCFVVLFLFLFCFVFNRYGYCY